jgi:hypothetical protein
MKEPRLPFRSHQQTSDVVMAASFLRGLDKSGAQVPQRGATSSTGPEQGLNLGVGEFTRQSVGGE